LKKVFVPMAWPAKSSASDGPGRVRMIVSIIVRVEVGVRVGSEGQKLLLG
jgi:hypothetical protein